MGQIIGYSIFGFGLLNLTLILFQLSSGMHWIKVPVKVHRMTGIALLASAAIHGGIAILLH